TSGEIELHQRVNGLRRRIDNVQQALEGTNLKLLAALLVDVRRPVHRELLDPGRQWNRPAYECARPLGGVRDFTRRLIKHPVIKGLQPDPDVLRFHGSDPSST